MQDIATLPAELLAVRQGGIAGRLQRAKAVKARFEGALPLRCAARAPQQRQVAGSPRARRR